MFASSSLHAFKTGDKVRVRLRKDEVRFVAGEVVSVGAMTCVVATTDDVLVRVPMRPEWVRKIALVYTRPSASRGAA